MKTANFIAFRYETLSESASNTFKNCPCMQLPAFLSYFQNCLSDPKMKEFAGDECDHDHDISDDCLLIHYIFKLCEEELEEIQGNVTVSAKDFQLMEHCYGTAKQNIIRWHFHIIRCINQQLAWQNAMEGSKKYIFAHSLPLI